MHTEQELRASHRRLVDIFRENRPVSAGSSQLRAAADVDGLVCRGWEATESSSRLAQYIQKHTYTHIEGGWSPTWERDKQCIAWLDWPWALKSFRRRIIYFIGDYPYQVH
jgi:hypothetical protein